MLEKKIKFLREKKGLSQNEIARMIGVSRYTVMNWESGKRNPDSEMLKIIAEVLETSVAYLVGEAGFHAPLNEEEAGTNKDVRATPLDMRNYLRVPIVSMRTPACAGGGNGLSGIDLEAEEWDLLERKSIVLFDDLRPPFGVYVEGDSMEEMDIPDGSVAYVNPAEEPRNGECALVVYRGQWSIKGVFINKDGSVTLRAGKPQYNLEIPADVAEDPMWFKIIGKVVEVKTTKKPKSFW